MPYTFFHDLAIWDDLADITSRKEEPFLPLHYTTHKSVPCSHRRVSINRDS